MTNVNEYTNEQLAGLDAAAVMALKERAAAEHGIPLPGAMPLPPEPLPYGPDIEIYLVGSLGFLREDDARRAATLLAPFPRITSRYWTRDWTFRVVGEKPAPLMIEKEVIWSEDALDAAYPEIVAHREATKRYEEQKKAVEAARKEFEVATKWVDERVAQAREHVRRVEFYAAMRDRYRRVALGDARMGDRFLLDAYPDAATYLPDLVEAPAQSEGVAS